MLKKTTKMVSLHSTYADNHHHGHHHHVKRRKKVLKNDPDLLIRPSFVDASIALAQIKKGKANGNKAALWLRSRLQNELFKLGSCIQRNAGKFLFVGILILGSLSVGLKDAVLETRVDKLWVEEGGRLQKELEYVENTLGIGAGATNELIIQTPKEDAIGSVLTTESLLTHLEVIKAAARVVVEKDDVTWQLKDLCYAPTIPLTEIQVIDQILDKLFPCAIVTPLDCFWEGSKLLGPDHPVHIPLGDGEGSMLLSWTTLNPLNLVQQMRSFNFEFDSFEEFMKTAGINSGYQEKPCLDPHDPDCPQTAPNKESKQRPDIGAELTGGCYGFATRYMHWPEQLVVGGTTKNKTGHITRAKGLQSSIQLMGEKDLYDYWSDTFKVHSLQWNREVANSILSEWQAKFSREVSEIVAKKQMDRKYEINAFSSSYLNDTLAQYSEVSFFNFMLGLLFMLLYVSCTLFKRSDLVKSQAGLGLSAVFLVVITLAGGLGACAMALPYPFNASTTQIIPFLALGLGVNSIFHLIPTYVALLNNGEIPIEDKVGEVLKRSGVWVLFKDICITAAFLASAIMPIPAFRAFSFQAAIVSGFNSVTMLVFFPALLGLDLRRVASNSLDLFCCYQGQRPDETSKNVESQEFKKSCTAKWNLQHFVTKYWANWVLKMPFKIATLLLASILTCFGLYGLAHLQQGLDMQEVVPKNTSAYEFIKAQNRYFGFYHMYAVTQEHFEYPQNQKTLYDYHNAFVRVPNIIKDDDGGLNEFWLPLFRNWLLRIQNAFDDDYSVGNIYEYGWHPNASADGILGYKLLVQTGHVDYPVDETLLLRNRLVDSHGMINPSAFYNYLSAWYSNDAMAYSHSQVSIVPTPKLWVHDARDADLRIPKSMPITFARIPFYLYNLGDTEIMVEMITQVRQVCAKFEEQRGLPNFPTGIPFTFWEQYINLRMWLLLAIASILAAAFIMTSILMMSPWIGIIVVLVVSSIVIQLFGFMEFLGVHLSAVPAVITILAIGLGVEFSLHIIIGFVTCIGSKNRRIMISLQHMFEPVFHGAVSTFLGIVMLAFSHFDFVVRYFFLVFTGLIVLGIFNGLIFLPVLLVLVGPPAEVIPNDGAEAIDPPTPHVEKKSTTRSNPLHKSPPNIKINATNLQHHKRHHHYNQSDLSLSTIAEESGSYASNTQADAYPMTSQSFNGASVFVEPHVVVETTTYPHGNASVNSSRSSTPTQQVTKVTATAKFKVEVHTPGNTIERPVSSRSGRRSKESLSSSGSVHSSLSGDSVRSSLSSNDGDAGFSEK